MDSNNGSENNNTQFPRRLFRLLSMGCGISRVDQSKDHTNHDEGSDGGQSSSFPNPNPIQPHHIHTSPVRFYRNFYCLGGDQSKPLIRNQSANVIIVDSDHEDHSTKPESSTITTTTTLLKDETIVAFEKMTMKRQDSDPEIEENHTSTTTENTILIIEKEPEKPGHINSTNNSFDGFFRKSKSNSNNNNNIVIEDDDNYYNGVCRGGSPSFREYCVDFDAAPTTFKSQDGIDGVLEEGKCENEETENSDKGMESRTIIAKKERKVRSFMNALQRRRAGRVRNFLNPPRRHTVQPNADFSNSQSQSDDNDTSLKLLAKAS